MFHSFHDILATSDGDSISVWSLANSSRILHIANKASVSRGSGRLSSGIITRPQSGTAVPINLSNSSLAGINTGAVSSSALVAVNGLPPGSISQQNLNFPPSATGGRAGRSSPDISPTAAAAAASSAPGAVITTMSWINESYDALLLVSPR